MKNVFVGWSPYQIMNILNYIYNYCRNDDNDIFVIDHGAMRLYIDGLKRVSLFNNVTLVSKNDFGKGIRNKVNRYKYYLRSYKYLTRQIGEVAVKKFKEYDYIYATGFDPFFMNVLNLNKKIHVIFLDDGLGFYLCDSRKIELSKKMRLLNLIKGQGWDGVNIEKQYLNCPELVVKKYKIETIKMPKITDRVFELLKAVFGNCKQKEYETRKIVYFGQPKCTFIADVNANNQIIEILKKYSADTVYRKHPMQNNESIEMGNIYIDNRKDLWELICGQYVDDETILIGAFSNAQFSPYFLYGKKPIIILLNKIILNTTSTLYKQVELFALNYKNVTYSNLYMPENIKQLDYLLKKLMSNA